MTTILPLQAIGGNNITEDVILQMIEIGSRCQNQAAVDAALWNLRCHCCHWVPGQMFKKLVLLGATPQLLDSFFQIMQGVDI